MARTNASISCRSNNHRCVADHVAVFGGVEGRRRAACDRPGRAASAKTSSQDVVVALLGDPYNNVAFWAEVGRVLAIGGRVIFTSPSYEWARQYRNAVKDIRSRAVFDVVDGRRISLPSMVMAPEEQVEIISQHGLQVLETAGTFGHEIRSPHSPKIWAAVAEGLPIVSGYLARKV